jgi:uncharacterized protein YaaW (UPF0174 family)
VLESTLYEVLSEHCCEPVYWRASSGAATRVLANSMTVEEEYYGMVRLLMALGGPSSWRLMKVKLDG